MNWYKTAQNNLQEQYQLIETGPKSIKITGSGVNEIINLAGKTISAKDLLNQVISRINPILIQNGVREINTDPISQANAAGLANSHQPGVIHADIRKIFNQYKSALPPTVQTDGVVPDTDSIAGLVKEVEQDILHQIGNVFSHESKHRFDMREKMEQNRPFSEVKEAPAEQFGESMSKKYFPTTFQQ